MITKTLAVEWVHEGFAADVLYWRCGRCEHDFVAPPQRYVGAAGEYVSRARQEQLDRHWQYARAGHRPRCWCGAEPEIVLHGLGQTGWTPRLPSWAPAPRAQPFSVLFYLNARDVIVAGSTEKWWECDR